MSITISPVNTNKSIVIVNGTGFVYANSTVNSHASVSLTGSTTLSVSYWDKSKSYYGVTSWQVIEFY